MSIKITYFVHGTTPDNEQHLSSGWNDVPLSELGRKQASELREQVKEKVFDAIFCSDLIRAQETAQIVWGDMHAPISDARLRECNYGEHNGGPSETVEPIQEQMIHERFINGESYEDVRMRIADFLLFLKDEYDNKHIAIVGHKAPQLALDVLLKGKSWEQAFAEDWRKKKAWQPGWEYEIDT